MIQPVEACNLVIDTRRVTDTWAVYEHQVILKQGDPPSTIMIGAAKLRDVYLMVDGKTNTEWAAIFANGGSVLVKIVATTLEKGEAFRHAQELVRTMQPMPICNLKGYNLRGAKRAVICLNNETRYNTQAEAAAALGIHPSALSRHLRGELTHANGLKFAYAAGER